MAQQWPGWIGVLTDQRNMLKEREEMTCQPRLLDALRQEKRLVSRQLNNAKKGVRFTDTNYWDRRK